MRKPRLKLHELPNDYVLILKKRIESRYIINDNGCWEWTYSRSPLGYGKISIKKRDFRAHRVYYQLVKGFISDELMVDHLCRNPPCINPNHLEAVTPWENNARGIGVTANNLRKTHCPYGHEYSEQNTKIRFNNGYKRRTCRTCDLKQDRERKRRYALERAARGLTAHGKIRKVRYHDRIPRQERLT